MLSSNNQFIWVFCLMALLGCPVMAQTNQGTQFTLAITSEAFADGIAPGESGTLNFQLTNDGPNDHTGTKQISIGHNLTHDYQVFAQITTGVSNDPNCEIIFPHLDPRPPVNDIYYQHHLLMTADIEVGDSFTCGFDITFTEPGIMETVWRFTEWTPNGNVFDENPYVFRGQAMPVPLNLTALLLVCVLLMGAVNLLRKTNP